MTIMGLNSWSLKNKIKMSYKSIVSFNPAENDIFRVV